MSYIVNIKLYFFPFIGILYQILSTSNGGINKLEFDFSVNLLAIVNAICVLFELSARASNEIYKEFDPPSQGFNTKPLIVAVYPRLILF